MSVIRWSTTCPNACTRRRVGRARHDGRVHRLLADLDDEQRAAALAVSGPVCIVAGAGTGKTRTVTHRLAYAVASGAVAPGQALAVTHSRKAAAELSERLHSLGAGGVSALTFHAAALRVASAHWSSAGRPGAAPAVLADGAAWRYWREAARAVLGREPSSAEVRDLVDEVSWARSRVVALEGYSAAAQLAGRHASWDAQDVVAAWAAYEARKQRAAQVDFADLLDIAARLLDDVEVAATVRARWAHVTVDEYQDTDPAQQRFLDAVLGGRRDVCVVGDPRQAIYAWKGADPAYLTGFSRRYPGAQVFDLTRNYRSVPPVLDVANRLARQRSVRALVATRRGGRPPRVVPLSSEEGEAAWVARAAARSIAAGTAPTEVAVLYRFNAAQARLEAAFARAGVPTVVAEDTTFFDREEVREVLVPFGRKARSAPAEPGLALLDQLLARAGFDPDRPPESMGAARARWESLQALSELARSLPGAGEADASSLLGEVNALARSTRGPDRPGVTLSTLHRSKGLEWDVVFIVGLTDGALPSAFATTSAELAEEERLLHVGVTRARRELYLTWASSNQRGWTNKPSPFLDLLGLGEVQEGARVGSVPHRARRSGQGQHRRSQTGGGRVAASAYRDGDRAAECCPYCATALTGLAARRVGACARCAVTAPGASGERARALMALAARAAEAAGCPLDRVLTDNGLLRLLAHRPSTAEAVAGTAGVGLNGDWAEEAAQVLV